MAVARVNNTYFFAAAGDNFATLERGTLLVCSPDGTNAGTFVFKNAAGTIFLNVEVPTATSVSVPLGGNDGVDLYGLEMDAAPTNGTATLFLK